MLTALSLQPPTYAWEFWLTVAALDAAVAQARWVLATLVLINAGALVALLPANLTPWPKIIAGSLFVLGLMAGLLCGHIGTLAFSQSYGGAYGALLGYWHTVEDDGERVLELEAELQANLETALPMKLTKRLGYAAASFFVAGCVVIGIGVLPPV